MKMKFHKIPTNGGGDCFFRALSIVLYQTQNQHRKLRKEIVSYISEHRDDAPFACIGFSTDTYETVDMYCKRMSRSQHGRHHGEYADEFVIVATALYLKRPIHIISSEYTYQGNYGAHFVGEPIYIHYAKHHFTALSVHPLKKPQHKTVPSQPPSKTHTQGQQRSRRLHNKHINYACYY